MFQLILLAITLACILPLVVAMYFAALALLDSLKRDTTPFLAPAFAMPRGKIPDCQHASVPFGVWQVACLASTYHHPVNVRENHDAHAARI